MKLKNFLLGAACGLAAGWLTTTVLTTKKTISSENVLNKVKQAVEGNGKVIGSWIMTKPEVIERNESSVKVFRGGLTQLNEKGQNHYEFIADAESGALLELKTL